MTTQNLLLINAADIIRHCQKIRNTGVYFVVRKDGTVDKIVHSEVDKTYTFEERISILESFSKSTHDLSSCYAGDLICYYLTSTPVIIPS
jgi:hypothetical protein